MVTRIFVAFYLLLQGLCKPAELIGPKVEKTQDFDSYWQQGKAEINSYDLYQARYGEMREGVAHLIFVTEEFSKEKQIKLDDANVPYEQKIPVLKLNLTKNFHTGIYPYSMMLSSFVPIGGVAPWQALKITSSTQEWCGHVYAQLNQKQDHYTVQSHSYFESEGDQKKKIDRYMTEDAIWNLIRINPEALFQTDSVMVIPSLLYCRLLHKDIKPYLAKTKKLFLDEGNHLYHIEYPELGRSLAIEYEPTFPFSIVKWSEEYKDGFGDNAKVLTTTAVRKRTLLSDYWTKNHNTDDSLRQLLQWDQNPVMDTIHLLPLMPDLNIK